MLGDQYLLRGEASNGAEALETVRAMVPDIVLLDVKMPVIASPLCRPADDFGGHKITQAPLAA